MKYEGQKIGSFADLRRALAPVERPVILVEGTRALPETDVPLVRAMGVFLAKKLPNAVFRSGNAEGTDAVFAEAIRDVAPDRIEVVLPYPGMGKARRPEGGRVFAWENVPVAAEGRICDYTVEASPDARRLVAAYRGALPNPKMAVKARYLLRDTLKVVGLPEAGFPAAAAGVFYVREGDPLSGGTGHTIKVCIAHQIPVVFQSTWRKWV